MSAPQYDPNKPAQNHMEQKRKWEAVHMCGMNRGPHDYIPIEWTIHPEFKQVSVMLCRVCFVRVDVAMLAKNFPKVSL